MKLDLKNRKKIVIKVGSALLVSEGKFSNAKILIGRKPAATTISGQLISVQPMSSVGSLMYLDYVYGEKKTAYIKEDLPIKLNTSFKDPIKNEIVGLVRIVEASTLEKERELFYEETIQIGDKIYEWDAGGWESLAGRAGECVVRRTNVVAIRMTKMS